MGLSLKPISIKIRKNSSPLSPNKLIGEMKSKMFHSHSNDLESGVHHNDVEYIFVNPVSNNHESRSSKELSIDSCLNDLGIFQVNIDVALNEYKL